MSYLLFIIVFYTFFHLYFQNVLVPGMLASKRLRLLELEDRVELLKSKNTISYSLYLGFALLFRASESIIDSPNGPDIYALESRNNEIWEKEQPVQQITDNSIGKDFSFWSKGTKNMEVSRILQDWEKCMKDAYKVSFYAWYAYLFPVVILDRLFGIFNHRAFNTWLLNIQPYKRVSSMI